MANNNSMRDRRLNIIAISVLAFLATQVIHELTHLIFAFLMGFEVSGFHLFAVNIDFTVSSTGIWGIAVVEAMASIVNILICLLAVRMFYYFKTGYMKLGAMMTAGFQGMMGFGYLLFDGLFYTPGALGDWKAVLDLFEGALILRSAIILIGAVGYVALFFWLGKAPLGFLSPDQRGVSSEREKVGRAVLLMPYMLSVLFNIPLAYWHPLGFPDGFFVVFFQYVFGYSGFVTGYFMFWKWLEPKPFLSSEEAVLIGERKAGLWVAAVIGIALQLLLVVGIDKTSCWSLIIRKIL